MLKRIELDDGHSIELNGSLGWLIIYQNTFGRDILPDVMPLIESFMGIAIEVLNKNKKKKDVSVMDLLASVDADMLSEIFINLTGMETTTVLKIIWAMSKKANKKIPSFEDYYDQFEIFPLDVVMPDMIRLIIESSVSSKNATSLLTILSDMKQETSR